MAVSALFVAEEVRLRLPSSNAYFLPHASSPERLLAAVTHDSRRVSDDAGSTLFCCVRGMNLDGHDFAASATTDGAAALLVDHPLDIPNHQIVVSDVRKAMGYAASIVNGDPSRAMRMVAITGTNGKTTTAHMLESILRAANRNPAVLGTLTQTRTTPEATDLHARLAELRDEGRSDVVMEVTSHALDLHRVNGCHFAVGIFTNLSQDHLDYHGTMERYFRTKAMLFVPELIDRAVVNSDDLYGRLLSDAALVPTTEIQLAHVDALSLRSSGSTFRWRGLEISLRLAGEFNVRNAICAAVAAKLLGLEDASIVEGLASAVVPGRYEPVNEGQSFSVVVDFAHTPDGLLNLLVAARASLAPHARLLTVFGCGGDRDRGKRPQMGSIAAMYSDCVILTSDNPRTEDAQAIVDEIIAGIDDVSNVTTVLDRRLAIDTAVRGARPDDVVLIAGKGHERGQESRGVVTPFDDRDVARDALRALLGSE